VYNNIDTQLEISCVKYTLGGVRIPVWLFCLRKSFPPRTVPYTQKKCKNTNINTQIVYFTKKAENASWDLAYMSRAAEIQGSCWVMNVGCCVKWICSVETTLINSAQRKLGEKEGFHHRTQSLFSNITQCPRKKV
jgi:hypothetical protein